MISLALLLSCTDAPVVDDDPTSSDRAETTDTTDAGQSSGDTGADPCGTPALEIGGGLETHSALEAGDGVVLVHGPQNGWHVDLSAGLRQTSDLMGFSATVTVVDGGLQIAGSQPSTFVSLVRLDECRAETAGLRFLVDDVIEPKGGYQEFICSLADADLDITLTGTDLESDTMLSDTVRVKAVLDEVDRTYNCAPE